MLSNKMLSILGRRVYCDFFGKENIGEIHLYLNAADTSFQLTSSSIKSSATTRNSVGFRHVLPKSILSAFKEYPGITKVTVSI